MTRREYLKYNTQAKDMLGKDLKPGDTVVINNNYTRTPYVGTLDHFTESGNCAIKYMWMVFKGREYHCWAYREPCTIIKLRSGRKKRK